MKSLDRQAGDVSAPYLVNDGDAEIGSKKLNIVASDGKRAGGGIVSDNHSWPQRAVLPAVQTTKVDQWSRFVHCATKSIVVVRASGTSLIAIAE